ncbi:MAG: DUF5702 domain-containing protein [Lachnospiraceae bacterium]|nr:DUF5702 domain-containing protein [Lachnospiraceae bacterium]
MKIENASITTFLSLILLLLFSFVLTSLEAARINASVAYAKMLIRIDEENFKAGYYYPLLQEYGLLGVDGGFGSLFMSEERVGEELEKGMAYSVNASQGGLLGFSESCLTVTGIKTLITDDCGGFLSQIRRQALTEGISAVFEDYFTGISSSNAGKIKQITKRQQKAEEELLPVTEEIMELMHLADGVCFNKNGMAFSDDGKVVSDGEFIKRFLVIKDNELKEKLDNNAIYESISGKCVNVDFKLAELGECLLQAYSFMEDRDKKNASEEEMNANEAEMQGETENEGNNDISNGSVSTGDELNNDELEDIILCQLETAVQKYFYIEDLLSNTKKVLKKALDRAEILAQKQLTARVSLKAYEEFLESEIEGLDEKTRELFQNELNNMKAYAGSISDGYGGTDIQRILKGDIALVEQMETILNNKKMNEIREGKKLSCEMFTKEEVSGIRENILKIKESVKTFSYEGLWFKYGEIKRNESLKSNAEELASGLVGDALFKLLGVDVGVSANKIIGTDLPSSEYVGLFTKEGLRKKISEIEELIESNDIGKIFKTLGEDSLNTMALEVYIMAHFSDYISDEGSGKLLYEREYILFGEEKDKENLADFILTLIAVRTVFTSAKVLSDPVRMGELTAFATSIVGFTGIPPLVSAVKYAFAEVWAIEEAIIEVAALLQGKKLSFVSMGCLSFAEIFIFTPALVKAKAAALPGGHGVGYTDYLTIISLMENTQKKCLRVLDLIQENIRRDYLDTFRVRNMIVGVDYNVDTKFVKKYDVGIFPGSVYRKQYIEKMAY